MQRDDESGGPILRVFEARAREGRVEEFAQKLATTSVGVVLDEAGNEGHFFGRGVARDKEVVLFVSVWKDLGAIKERFGEDWESSFLPEDYNELIAECSWNFPGFGGHLLRADSTNKRPLREAAPVSSGGELPASSAALGSRGAGRPTLTRRQ